MSNSTEFNASVREQHGKAHARRLRHNKQIPAVVYGADKQAQAITLSEKETMYTLQDDAIFSQILTLNIAGKKESVVIKSVQHHATKPRFLHIDFLRIKAKEKLTMSVPIHFEGEEKAPGVKAGGVVSHLINEIEIRCLPADLPTHLTLDIAKLELDQSLHVTDLALPAGVEFATAIEDEEHNQPVVNIHKPKVAAEPIEEAEEKEGEEGKAETDEAKAEEKTDEGKSK